MGNRESSPTPKTGWKVPLWRCDRCDAQITENEDHYVCTECTDFDLCAKCKCDVNHESHPHYLFAEHVHWSTSLKRIAENKNLPWMWRTVMCEFEDRPCLGMIFPMRGLEPCWTWERAPPKEIGDFCWLTYSRVFECVLSIAEWMMTELQLGRPPPDGFPIDRCVILCGRNRAEWLLTDLACAFLGIAAIPIHYASLDPIHVGHILERTRPIAVFTEAPWVHAFAAHLPASRTYLLERDIASVARLASVTWVHTGSGREVRPDEATCAHYAWTASAADAPSPTQKSLEARFKKLVPSLAPNQDARRDRIYTIIWTSGSTGRPKGVVFYEWHWLEKTTETFSSDLTVGCPQMFCNMRSDPQARVVGNSDCVQDHFASRVSPGTALTVPPLALAGGRRDYQTTLTAGGRVALYGLEPLDQLFAICRLASPSYFVGAPRVYESLRSVYTDMLAEMRRERPEWTEADRTVVLNQEFRYALGRRSRHFTVGGAMTPDYLLEWMRAVFGYRVNESYGTTEAGGIYDNHRLRGTVELKLADIPELGIIGDPTCGEVCVRTNNMASGYFRDPEANAAQFDSEGYFRTGDIGRLNAQGDLTLVGRCRHVYKLAQGEFISPAKVESLFAESALVEQIFVHVDPSKAFVVAVAVPALQHVTDMSDTTESQHVTDMSDTTESQHVTDMSDTTESQHAAEPSEPVSDSQSAAPSPSHTAPSEPVSGAESQSTSQPVLGDPSHTAPSESVSGAESQPTAGNPSHSESAAPQCPVGDPSHAVPSEAAVLADLARLARQHGVQTFQVPRAVHLTPPQAFWTPANGLLTPSRKPCRHQLARHFEAEIAALYARVAAQQKASIASLAQGEHRCVMQLVEDLTASLMGQCPSLQDTSAWDLTLADLGCDSMGLMRFRALLASATGRHADEFPPQLFYLPFRLLGQHLAASLNLPLLLHDDEEGEKGTHTELDQVLAGVIDLDVETRMPEDLSKLLLEKECGSDGSTDSSSAGEGGHGEERERSVAVFLTGATGFLGAHILAELLCRDWSGRAVSITCLVRVSPCDDPDAAATRRLRETLQQYRLWDACEAHYQRHVTALPGDLRARHFGQSDTRYAALLAGPDAERHIIHAAASSHFLAPYQALRAVNVHATLHCLRLALERGAALHHVSTGSVSRFPGDTEGLACLEPGRFPRGSLGGEALGLGYPQSKWVAEHLVQHARRLAPHALQCTVWRPGFICASGETGAARWDDVSCRLVRSCLQMGAAPQFTHAARSGALAWCPVDGCARALVEVVMSPRALGCAAAQPAIGLTDPEHQSTAPPSVAALFTALTAAAEAIQPLPWPAWRERVLQGTAQSERHPLAPFTGVFESASAQFPFSYPALASELLCAALTRLEAPDGTNAVLERLRFDEANLAEWAGKMVAYVKERNESRNRTSKHDDDVNRN